MRPKDLFDWQRQNGWIYKRAGNASDLGYQAKTLAGLLEHKVTTVLRADGTIKAEVTPQRAMLGVVAGGAVCVAQGAGRLVVAEGIETALSLACGLLPGAMTLWAALSTSGLRGLHLPSKPGALTVATDGDEAGRSAGDALAERAHALGWKVSTLPAPDGRDWNDILTMKGDAA